MFDAVCGGVRVGAEVSLLVAVAVSVVAAVVCCWAAVVVAAIVTGTAVTVDVYR